MKPTPMEASVIRNLTKAALAVVAALALGGAAQAAQVNIAISVNDRGAPKAVRYGAHDHGPRRHTPSPWDYGHDRQPDRYYGRPVPERSDWNHPSWARAAYGRPHWRDHDDCRQIIKKTVNPWGTTVKHIKICE